MQPVKTSTMFNKQRGMTLLELVVVLTITAVLAAATLQFSGGMRESVAFQQTQDRVQAIKNAIINVQTVNGVPVVSGFAADMGRLPHCLQELLTSSYTCNGNTTPDPAWGILGECTIGAVTTYETQTACNNGGGTFVTFSDLSNSNAGWHGPYLQTSNSPISLDAYTDGWGKDYQDVTTTYPTQVACEPTITPTPPRHWLLDVNNAASCHQDDFFNYGWYFSTALSSVLLQSYGSDRLPDSVTSPVIGSYQADYPSLSNQPVIQPQNWQFPLSSTTSMTVNLLADYGGFCTTTLANICSSINGNSACTFPQTLTLLQTQSACVPVLGGQLNASNNCVLTDKTLNSSTCSTSIPGATWNSGTGQCDISNLPAAGAATICAGFGGALTASTCAITPPTDLSTTCTSLGGTWLSPNCTITTGITLPAPTTVATQYQFGSLLASASTGNPATLVAPAALVTQASCTPVTPYSGTWNFDNPNICLNVFYRDLNTSDSDTPIVVATAPATTRNDGQPHSINFSPFTVYTTDATSLSLPVNGGASMPPIPAGQNAISVTQANADGTCSNANGGIPWNNAPYPANHSATPVPQIFKPGMSLIFNW